MKQKIIKLKNISLIGVLIFGIYNCGHKKRDDFLGSAVVDGKTYTVSSIILGKLINANKDEGSVVNKGELLAIVDTIQLDLCKKEIQMNIDEIASNIESKQIDINAGKNDAQGAHREYVRAGTLSGQGALPTQQRDNLKTQYKSVKLRVNSNQKGLESLVRKIEGLLVRIDQTNALINNCYLYSQSSGIIITKYLNTGEIVSPCSPVYKISKFDTLYADFFAPQPVISTLNFGQSVRVRIDYDSGKGIKEKYVPGEITWINNDAEFSPKNIQTRESRNELVFRVRVTIANSKGILKRGLPVEIWR